MSTKQRKRVKRLIEAHLNEHRYTGAERKKVRDMFKYRGRMRLCEMELIGYPFFYERTDPFSLRCVITERFGEVRANRIYNKIVCGRRFKVPDIRKMKSSGWLNLARRQIEYFDEV